jgi:hypothetical protein
LVERYVPSVHALQARFIEGLHSVEVRNPAEHVLRQGSQVPKPSAENVSAAHVSQTRFVDVVHCVASYCPAAQTASQLVHTCDGMFADAMHRACRTIASTPPRTSVGSPGRFAVISTTPTAADWGSADKSDLASCSVAALPSTTCFVALTAQKYGAHATTPLELPVGWTFQ